MRANPFHISSLFSSSIREKTHLSKFQISVYNSKRKRYFFLHINKLEKSPKIPKEKEGGMIPSLLSYRTKQLALFVLERELHSKTERTNTIDAGYVCIV